MAEETVRVGRQGHLAPEDHELRHAVLRVVIAALEAAGVVKLGIQGAEHHLRRHHARLVAGVTGLGVSQVGRTEDGQLEVLGEHAIAAGAHEDGHGLASVLVGEATPVVHDDVEGLVPAAALPCIGVSALLLRALLGIDDARGVIDVILEGDAPGAQAALGDGIVFVAFHMVKASVLVHVELDAASDGVATRGRPHRGANYGEVTILELPRLT